MGNDNDRVQTPLLTEGNPDVERLVEAIQDVFYVFDEEMNLVEYNDQLLEVTGYSREEAEAMEPWEFFPAEEREHILEKVTTVVQHGEQVRTESKYLRKDGEAIPYEFTGSPLYDEDGSVVGFVGIGRDITDRREREAELFEKQQILDRITENFDDVIWMTTPGKDEMEFVTEAYEEVWGRSLASLEANPESFVEAIHEDDRQRVLDALKRQATDPESYDETYRVVQPDGEVRWVHDRAFPVEDEDGNLAHVLGVASDITERKERERELREREQKYQRLTERISEGYYAFDEQWRVTYWNDTVARRQGIPAEDILGDVLWERFPEVEDTEYGATLRRAMETQQPQSCEFYYEPDDYWVDVEAHPDEDGLAVLSRDITERKERERALERVEERLQFALDATNTGVWEWNLETDEMTWTETMEGLFGLGPGEFDGTFEAFAERVHPEDLSDIEAALERALDTDEPFEAEYRIQRPDDTEIWGHARGEIVTRDGSRRMIGVVTDVTDRKERERQLAESNERLEQFAYVVSHDLQEPLRTVSNYTQMLEDEYADELDEEAARIIDVAVTGSERMQSMLNGLLDYSRINTRGGAFTTVDATEEVADVATELRTMLDEQASTLDWEQLPTITADRDQFRRLIQNLVKNALEHSGDDAVGVEIRGETLDDHYRFEVADDGPGIDPQRQDDIFRLFNSGEQYQTESQARGIGLAICDNIVRRHDGDIRVESEPGEGATFVFTLAKEPGEE